MVDDTGAVSQSEVGDEANFSTTKLSVDNTFDINNYVQQYAMLSLFILYSYHFNNVLQTTLCIIIFQLILTYSFCM